MHKVIFSAAMMLGVAACDNAAPKKAAEAPAAPAEAPAAPNAGEIIKDCDTCPEVVVIPPGSFTKGFDGGEPERYEGAPHEVTIGYSFGVGKTEVTNGQFKAFVEATGHQTDSACNIWDGKTPLKTPNTGWTNPGYGRPPADNEPAACVSWVDAKAYADWLSKKTGQTYRLLTESEWEYTARAGATGRFTWGDDMTKACETANVPDLSTKDLPPLLIRRPFEPVNCNDGYPFIAPAGALKPNAFGVYDTIGSVWEWVEDCYVFPYPENTPKDGSAYTGPDGCDRRVSKGGSWSSPIERQHPTFRGRDPNTLVSQLFGFRIARDLN